jgi:2-polyprenyl-3-methyl-5-hydroxy-6-metoxy-1,4-benzoquinol methylase
MTSKTESVRSLFSVPEKYLGRRQFDINIRVETIQQFAKTLEIDRVLDIGCGNGAISLPLLIGCRRLTLLDLSREMLELAKQRIPPERRNDVALIEGELLDANLEPQSFDLILCIGVLAHVDSVAAVIDRVALLAKPGSWVIIEFTDSFHFWGIQTVVYQKLLKLLRPEPYALNRLSKRDVESMFRASGLSISTLYRYGLPPIGSSLVLGHRGKYRLIRCLFGFPNRNRNRWMGNQFLYLLQKR